ncbi:hypothetical protein LguiA_029919 [Lonicera macranthoides]
MLPLLVTFLILTTAAPSIFALDFLYNSFNATTNLLLTGDVQLDPPVIRFTNDSNQFSIGRFFHSSQIPLKPTSNSTTLSSFSTQFIFSVLPEISSGPGFSTAFVLSGSTIPLGALSSQYFGIFSNSTVQTVVPLLLVKFHTGRNLEFNDPDGNHVGIDLNNIESTVTQTTGYFNSTSDVFVPVDMRNGHNIHAWIEFDGSRFEINVTIALAAQRVLAWSLSDTGVARDINTSNLLVFSIESSYSLLSNGAIAGITIGCVFVVLLCLGVYYWFWRKQNQENDEIEDWELEYWPHRYSYEELSKATNGFSKDEVLGSGGFGQVYKATLPNNTEMAVKCVNHDSKQGLREFMAEISSMGRLQHKNLVQMRGWCRKGNELLLVYDYMPNGSLNRWIFDKPNTIMGWESRKKVLADMAEGLNYLHHGRLGDFGLAKLYTHGEVPNTTRVVGTLGYMALEVATMAAPIEASDVYSFGVVVLEVACGGRPIKMWAAEEEVVLIDWVRGKYGEGRLCEAADERIKGEYKVEEMEAVLKLGLACCHPGPLHRPTMREVVAILLGEEATADPSVLLSELTEGGGSPSGHGGGEAFLL